MSLQGSRYSKYYHGYIKSIKWRRFTAWVKLLAGGKCEQCESSDRLTVHHRHYRTLGQEKAEDVIVLCWECHQLEHLAAAERRKAGYHEGFRRWCERWGRRGTDRDERAFRRFLGLEDD